MLEQGKQETVGNSHKVVEIRLCEEMTCASNEYLVSRTEKNFVPAMRAGVPVRFELYQLPLVATSPDISYRDRRLKLK